MTAPKLVDVVAEVLEEHCIDDDEICPCGCDVRDSETRFLRTHELRIAHQARAVLAALTEAGAVQFGVRWHVGGFSGINRCTSKRHAERQAAKLIESGHEAAIVSRLTLPWERAE